jgi:hypothetical protein
MPFHQTGPPLRIPPIHTSQSVSPHGRLSLR